MKVILWIGGTLLAAFVTLVIVETIRGPRTLAEVAAEHSEDCVRAKGYGSWVASSGVSLELFCRNVGLAKTLLDDRKANPERY